MILSSIIDHWNVPGYNYYFEIAAIVFILILGIRYLYHKRFPFLITRFFLISLVVAFLDISVDIVASILVEKYINTCPIWVNSLFNGVFYVLQVWVAALLFMYTILVLGPKVYKNKLVYLFFLPSVIFTLLIAINPLTDWVFYFDLIDTTDPSLGLGYMHGPLFLCYYGTAIFYFALTIIFTIVFRNTMTKRHRITLYFAILIILLGIGIQIIFPTILLTGITIATSLYFVDDNIANPDDLVDKITNVFNFNALNLYIDKMSNDKKETYVLSVDVKNIETINETLGIVVGNKVYHQVGQFFNTFKRHSFTFRIFSSKFVILFKNKKEAERALITIKERFEQSWFVENTEFILSCMLVEFADSAKHETINQFLNYAELLMEETAKEKVDNVICINNKHIEKIERELKIKNILKEALTGNCQGFWMVYQPILNTKTKKFDNAEALLRFKCEELGQISPAEFVPLAEKAGLANELDNFVLRSVCVMLQNHPEIEAIEINVSGAEFFTNPSQKFIQTIREYHIDPKRVCFEITETATIKYPKHIANFMSILKQEGFRFAIDDFGTGYSNVSQLLKLPFDVIKLDRTLLEDNEKTRSFTISMNKLFKDFKYPIVIEGVENEDDLIFAREQKFDFIQGYYFSKPLSEVDFLNFIKNKDAML